MTLTAPIRFYLPRLTDDGLIELMRWAKHVSANYQKLSQWMAEILVPEYERRQQVAADVDEPADVELPDFICQHDWTGAELGDALSQFSIFTYTISDKSAGEFVDLVCRHIQALCCIRLQEWDELRRELVELRAERAMFYSAS